jgi:pimeloyl-ACP methyl ester carboxylesterase
MLEMVEARFKNMKLPSFPMANLLVFWGGFINDFPALSHNPVDYAETIKVPVLLLYGSKDDKVSEAEIKRIYNNLKGRKTLETYPKAGHENYLIQYAGEWERDVKNFLKN